jgi:hypothetical protein
MTSIGNYPALVERLHRLTSSQAACTPPIKTISGLVNLLSFITHILRKLVGQVGNLSHQFSLFQGIVKDDMSASSRKNQMSQLSFHCRRKDADGIMSEQ